MVNHDQPEPKPVRTPWPKRILIALAILGVIGYFLWDTFYRHDAVTHTMALRWQATGRPGVVEGQVVDELDNPLGGLDLHVQDPSGGAMATTDSRGCFEVRMGESEITGIEIRAVGKVQWGLAGTSVGALDASDGLRFHIIVRVPPPAPRTRPAIRPSTQPG